MTTALSRRRHLAVRGACATALVAAVFVSPSFLGLTWHFGGAAIWTATLCAAICLAWPPLSRRGQVLAPEEGEEPSWAVAATGAWFGVCVLAPPAALGSSAALGSPGASLADLALGGAAVGLSAAMGATRAAWRPGHAVLALAAAAAMLLFGPSMLGIETPVDGANPPGVPGAAGQEVGRVWPVSIAVEGEGEREVGLEGYPPLLIRSDWIAGEKRTVRAWMAGPENISDWEVFAAEAPGMEAVRLLPGAAEYVAPGWAVRGGASLEVPGEGWPVLASIVVLLGLVGCVAIQRSRSLGPAGRVVGHMVVAAGAVLGIGLLADRAGELEGPEGSSGVSVTEGRRLVDGGMEWVQIQRSFGVMEWGVGGPEGGPESGPEAGPEDALVGQIIVGGRLGVERTERDVRQGSDGMRVVARDPLAPIDWRRPFDSGLRLLRPEVNTWGEFEACWERTPGGEWRFLGGWGLGLAMPEPLSDVAAGPPGWCASGLSQGTSVFVGQLAGSGQRAGEAWVRLVGFRS